ncbi:ADP-ribosylglycohydrolase family protein [Methylobacterium sp. WL120]|uniref:ADP-ribosylglycohydrolase family protein n=1 Tax=Methylobacterium sp. WL120 TaxID=2603887 RepID=UPI0011C7BF2B|nr:ADP-ribosylglycohydrolase family protein [Methylobacterium sp. WL120]TXM66861.1 hypothetical protein FV229_11585 [Methylobacterium sp. WL120]
MDKDGFNPAFAVFGSHSRNKGRTSITHPIRIDAIFAGKGLGNIGITFCPGKVQADAATGSWARDLRTDLEAISEWGASTVVSLIETPEIETLQVEAIGEECRRLGLTWIHLPIPDVSTPTEAFEASWVTVGEGLRSVLRNGFSITVFCKGGLGRSGTIAARLLTELGADPAEAIRIVREARPGAIETEAQEQHILRRRKIPERSPATTIDAIRDRALGALVGLAIGDATGTTIEFSRRDTYPPMTDMVGGGPFNLKAGQWTDDTSMALCLADSLIACDGIDERDLLERFCRWFEDGENSCTGTCFDIGNATVSSLRAYRETGDIHAASADPRNGGNGSIMRLAPVAIRYWNDPEKLRDAARRQSATTHPAAEPCDGSEALAVILARAIQGKPLSEVLNAHQGPYTEKVQRIADGSWRGKHRDDIRSSGYVVDTLEASIWAVAASAGSFEETVLRAVNLGDDSDSVGAVTGSIAGAIYGWSGIPERWRKTLVWNVYIEALGNDLFEGSLR